MNHKDIYSLLASKLFNTSYEECLEYFPKGTPIVRGTHGKWYYANVDKHDLGHYDKLADGVTDVYRDGYKRRAKAKRMTLGMSYGRNSNFIKDFMKMEELT